MEYIEVSAKTVEDAISEAAIKLEVPSDKIEYEVITEGSTGFLGLIGSKPAVIKARKKFNLLDHTKDFLVHNQTDDVLKRIQCLSSLTDQQTHVFTIKDNIHCSTLFIIIHCTIDIHIHGFKQSCKEILCMVKTWVC